RTFPPALLFIGPQVLGEVLGTLHRRPDATEATQTVCQTIPIHRLAATHGSNGPAGHMQSPQAHRLVDVWGTPRPGRHAKGGGDRKDRTAWLQTQAATQEWRLQ